MPHWDGMVPQEKKLKNWYIQEYTTGTTFEPKYFKTFEKKWRRDHGGFQQQSPQRLIDRYDHINSRNKRQDLCLKPIEAEYYSIGN